MKLTREQAEWLQGMFDKETAGIRELAPYDIRVILHKCTEKEFPALNHPVTRADGAVCSHVKIEEATLSPPWAINLHVSGEFVGMKADEFKQFALGVNKVVEWLDEAN